MTVVLAVPGAEVGPRRVVSRIGTQVADNGAPMMLIFTYHDVRVRVCSVRAIGGAGWSG